MVPQAKDWRGGLPPRGFWNRAKDHSETRAVGVLCRQVGGCWGSVFGNLVAIRRHKELSSPLSVPAPQCTAPLRGAGGLSVAVG